MKKLILPILLIFASLFFLPQQINSQEPNCRKTFDQDLKKCSTDSNSCQAACSEKTKKPDGTIYFNSGEIYTKCMKESQCHEKRSACGDQALANFRACGKSDKQSKTAETKKEPPKFVEIINNLPLEMLTVTFFSPSDFEQSKTGSGSDIPQDIKELFEKFKPMTNEEFQELWSSNSNDLAEDEDKRVDKWGDGAGAVMSSPSWEDIKFKEPVKNSNTQETLRMVELDQGQLEVKLKEPDRQNKFGVQGDLFDLFVIQTHFWVGQSNDKKSAIIAVYEGEVEVKTKDGKTIRIKPDGDPSTSSGQGKPGVVVISQKLSVIKLTLIGLVLAAVIGSITMILRKKLGSRGFSKKKK